jgi:hypothetical protein
LAIGLSRRKNPDLKLYIIGPEFQGAGESWAIDTKPLQTHIFTKPSTTGYLERRLIEASEVLAPSFAPEIAVKMAALPLL